MTTIYTDPHILYLRIMRGLPGSGKTTLANKLATLHNAVVFSADDFHIINGVYKWNKQLAPTAHHKNMTRTLDALRSGISVYYDNINTTYWDFFQVAINAHQIGAKIEFIYPSLPWSDSVEECHRRSSHAIDLTVIRKINDKFMKNIDTTLFNRLITEYNTVLGTIRTNILFIRPKGIPWTKIVQIQKNYCTQDQDHMKHLILSLYTMLPPMCDPCITFIVVTDLSQTDDSNNFYVTNSGHLIINKYMRFDSGGKITIKVPQHLKSIIDLFIYNKKYLITDSENTVPNCSMGHLVHKYFNIEVYDIIASFINFIHWNHNCFTFRQLQEIWNTTGFTPDQMMHYGDDNTEKYMLNESQSITLKHLKPSTDIYQDIYLKIYDMI